MSWIQENKFVAMLGAATAAGALLIGYFGFSARGKYAQALEDYKAATGQIDEFKSMELYPDAELIAGKRKNLNEYREKIAGLQKSFDKFRPKELPSMSPQEFQDQAKSANEEVAKACTATKTALPEGFFIGFEAYNSSLPRAEATGVLAYQLGAIKEVILATSKNGVTQVQNLHRPKTAEEDGRKWEPGKDDTARAYPLEFTFKGTPKAIRQVISDMLGSENYFFVVRTMRITNEKHGTPPTKDDARFEAPAPAGGAAAVGGVKPANDPFGGFVLPGDEAEKDKDKDKDKDKPVVNKPADKPKPAAATGRILQQVLGKEEIQVFLRVDIMRFLPATQLPEVPN